MARIIPIDYPGFTYTGTYTKEWDETWGWYLILKTGGALTFTENQKIDIFLCGGGNGGGKGGDHNGGSGGRGGGRTTALGIQATAGQSYAVVVGGQASASSAFDRTAAGGAGSYGGSGGRDSDGARWGGSGADGELPFGEYGTIKYGAGGGGGAAPGGGSGAGGVTGGGRGGYDEAGNNGTVNTGGGGGGGDFGWESGGSGASGIVIIRNAEVTTLPVNFKGTTLLKMFFNGAEVRHLIHNGKQLFMEGMNAWRSKHLMRSALAAR